MVWRYIVWCSIFQCFPYRSKFGRVCVDRFWLTLNYSTIMSKISSLQKMWLMKYWFTCTVSRSLVVCHCEYIFRGNHCRTAIQWWSTGWRFVYLLQHNVLVRLLMVVEMNFAAVSISRAIQETNIVIPGRYRPVTRLKSVKYLVWYTSVLYKYIKTCLHPSKNCSCFETEYLGLVILFLLDGLTSLFGCRWLPGALKLFVPELLVAIRIALKIFIKLCFIIYVNILFCTTHLSKIEIQIMM